VDVTAKVINYLLLQADEGNINKE